MTLIQRAYLNQLHEPTIRAEIEAQLDLFLRDTGCYPDFIDGHHHVHQLPTIREALIKSYESLNLDCPIRHTHQNMKQMLRWFNFPKSILINLVGGRTFKCLLEEHHIPTNVAFDGVYPFQKANRYPEYFDAFLTDLPSNSLIMCHPGKKFDPSDPITQARTLEYQFFKSDAYLFLLLKHHISLDTFDMTEQ